MAAKLTEITTQYHTFVDDQVLTKDQLNEFINYFEDQDRLSRVFLHGVGIVCGFNLKYNVSEEYTTITITQGVGVTTDGDLITLRKPVPLSGLKSVDLEELEFTHVRKFEDKFAAYPFFKRVETIGKKVITTPIEMWEILPEEEENASLLNTLNNLDNMTVLLYLESFAREGDLCTTIDCDNQGVEQVARLRVLLVSKEDAEYIAQNDPIFSKHDVAEKFTELPDVAVRRVVLDQVSASDYASLKKAYYNALNSDNLLINLPAGMKQLYEGFGPLLQIEPFKDHFEKFPANLKKVVGFSSFGVPFDFQYRYDFIKDLVDTWNEIKALLLQLKEECFPYNGAFPKHLLLGNLDEADDDLKHNRHQFYKSPALTCGFSKLKICRSLVARIFEMIEGFGAKAGEVKITPSNKLPELSFRAIPFYFDVHDKLLRTWNYQKTKKFKHTTNLSYHRQNLDSAPHIQQPLNFNIDRFDFFRIEGHQGKNFKTALEEINTLKERHGLAFDLKALSLNINRENLNLEDYECEFEDLDVMLRSWTAEQECILAEVSSFFSAFSLAEPGRNIKATDFTKKVTLGSANLSVNNTLLTHAKKTSSGTSDDTTFRKETTFKSPFLAYSTVVPDNLTTSENALGGVLKGVMEENEGKSVNDVIVNAKEKLAAELSDEVWANQPELKQLVIDDSVEILAWSNELVVQMPAALRDFSAARVDTYNLTLKQLCARVQKMKAAYQTSTLDQGLKAVMAILINQLSIVCCSGKKLEVLYEEINKRKENILIRLQLSKFAEKHPGLEHKAGVEPGGTFVLVFLNKTQQEPGREVIASSDLTAELKEKSTLKTTSTKSISGRITEMEKLMEAVKSGEIADKDISKIERLLMGEPTKLAARAISEAEVPNNTVIADFSLPYMCCSDCAPVNFIIQKPPAWLRLEKDVYCLGDNVGVRFEVSPEDGEIQADPEVPGMTIEDKKLIFNPSVFPEELLGEKITFTVNQQVTEAELTVFKAPQVDFEAPERAPVGLEITFEPFGDIEGVFFLWDFGDGSPTSTERNPTHRYTGLPDNDGNTVVVTLMVTAPNSGCSTTVEHEIQLFEIIIEVDLTERDFCETDETGHPFTVTAEGADVVIEGPGVERDANGNFVFVPANAGVGDHRFTINGESSGIVATVHAAPVVRFEPRQEGNRLILANNSTGAVSYVWSINEDKVERDDASPVVIDLTPDSPTTWTLALEATSEFCGTVATDVMTFQTDPIKPPADTCVETATKGMLADLEILQSLNLSGSNFVAPIWMSTSQLYGGTDEFNKGVLNDVENFLKGNNNDQLPGLFMKLLTQTSSMIIELSGNPENKEFQHLVQLFALQLRLFYNVLGCQSNEVINASDEIPGKLFEQILSILRNFRERKIKLPETLRTFLEEWAERVAGKGILEDHVKIIFEENLV